MSFTFELDNDVSIELATAPGVFVPTHTSALCIEAVRNQDPALAIAVLPAWLART